MVLFLGDVLGIFSYGSHFEGEGEVEKYGVAFVILWDKLFLGNFLKILGDSQQKIEAVIFSGRLGSSGCFFFAYRGWGWGLGVGREELLDIFRKLFGDILRLLRRTL